MSTEEAISAFLARLAPGAGPHVSLSPHTTAPSSCSGCPATQKVPWRGETGQ